MAGLYRKGLYFPTDHHKTRIRMMIVKVLQEKPYIVVNINIKLQVLLVACVWFFFHYYYCYYFYYLYKNSILYRKLVVLILLWYYEWSLLTWIKHKKHNQIIFMFLFMSEQTMIYILFSFHIIISQIVFNKSNIYQTAFQAYNLPSFMCTT